MQHSEPKFSIITVNYNGLQDTRQLVHSLDEHLGHTSYELIVVDNGSRNDESVALAAEFGWIKTIRSESNLGFAGGNNLGIRASVGRHIILLNNDTFVEDSSLEYLCDKLDANPRIGAVCPKIRFAWGSRPIQFAGYTPLTPVTLRNSLVGYMQPDSAAYATPHATPYAHGAAMAIRRDVIERVGLMPELYFLYYEELDWSESIRRAGYEIWYEPRTTVFHKESRSTGRHSPFRLRFLVRNRLVYAIRNRSCGVAFLSVLYQFLVANPLKMIKFAIKADMANIAAVVGGSIDFLKMKNAKADNPKL